jgi:hypothetical protein
VRQLKPEQWAILGLGVLVIGYVGMLFASQLRDNADLIQPSRQAVPADPLFAANAGLPVALDGYSRVCMPAEHHTGYVYTPHRYPRMVGGNVTATIHRGFSTMRIPHEDDVQWIISPPSEVQW